uniref:NECAP endocytosis associated 2 n=1 Tax=Lepisosteus oculatus TaxID=7918 RepID=W5MMA4_LEPOC
MADSSGYESVICVKPEVHVYRIPPRTSNRGYRAADWKLDEPAWTGRMRITSKGKMAYIRLEDALCAPGELFAQAPVEQYPGIAVEGVADSSRYFVVRIEDGSGRHAFIGIGFADRGDSFDFNVALQDHFKWVRKEGELAREEASQSSVPKLDLGFKEGQTIKINIGNMKRKEKDGAPAAARSRPAGSGLLPPPPGVKGAGSHPTPGAEAVQPPSTGTSLHSTLYFFIALFLYSTPLLDFDLGPPTVQPSGGTSGDLWGDFTAAPSSGSSQDSFGPGWVQF